MASALTPAISIHIAMAISALLLGPAALTFKKGTRRHRAAGYAWVTLMLGAALSALFIRRPGAAHQLAGYTPAHLLIPLALGGMAAAIYAVVHGRRRSHQFAMWSVYLGACVTAGGLALMPHRLLGQLVWGRWLGWV